MKKTVLSLMLASLVATPMAAVAKPKRNLMLDDLKCIAVVSVTAEAASKDDDTQAGLTALLTYFIGKMHGRDPKVDAGALFKKYEADIEALDIAAETPRCTGEMEKATNAMDGFSAAGKDALAT